MWLYFYFSIFLWTRKAGVDEHTALLHHLHTEMKYSRTAAPCDSFGPFSLKNGITLLVFLNMTSE